MAQTLLFALGASLPLTLGALVGLRWRPPRRVLAGLMAFAAGALLCAVAFELFEPSREEAGLLVASAAFAAGAATFVVLDLVIDRWSSGGGTSVGLALLAGVTLDGIPENTALGITLATGGGSIALLAAVFASNFPEALAGTARMRDEDRSARFVLALWGTATVALALAVVAGRLLFGGSGSGAGVPLGFAAGAVLASVVDTIAPEAYEEGGPVVALASAAGFLVSFLLGHG